MYMMTWFKLGFFVDSVGAVHKNASNISLFIRN